MFQDPGERRTAGAEKDATGPQGEALLLATGFAESLLASVQAIVELECTPTLPGVARSTESHGADRSRMPAAGTLGLRGRPRRMD